MKRMTWLVVGLLLGCGAMVQGANRYVSLTGNSIPSYTNWADAATNIQDAVDAAGAGDIIYITNGTYTLTNQVSITKAITLEGVNGSSNTFINGNGQQISNRCFYVSNNLAIISGLTISNGLAWRELATPWWYGGGVYLAAGLIRSCVISSNTARTCGGGVFLAGPTAIITNCTITRNYAWGWGGGVYWNDGGGTVKNCTLSYNSVLGNGGGVAGQTAYGNAKVLDCTVVSNSVGVNGGGIYTYYGGIISNCIVAGNTAPAGSGGGVFLYRIGSCYNCLVVSNTSNSGGGGVAVFCDSDSSYMYNCTVVGNTANNTGGGGVFYTGVGGASYLYNSVVWGNTCAAGSNITATAAANIAYTCSGPVQTGTGNIGNDPLFQDAKGHLSANSPCVNTGTNGIWTTGAGATDLDGQRRISPVNGTVDMGAYERQINQGIILSFH